MPSQNGTQAIDRAAALLTQVVDGPDAVSFADLTVATGLAKSTTSRLLMALERHQLIRRDEDGRYWPGEVFVRYAWRGSSSTDLVAVAQPFLDQLGDKTGETVNLGIASVVGASRVVGADEATRTGGVRERGPSVDPGTPVVEPIAQVESRYLIGATNWVGLTVPLHCSALGKVLLAYGAAEMPRSLDRHTERTIVSKRALQAELAAVRERGHAVSFEELEPGLVAVAAPVFAGGDAAIAALSVSSLSTRLTADEIPATARLCAEIASDLSAALTGPLGPDPERSEAA